MRPLSLTLQAFSAYAGRQEIDFAGLQGNRLFLIAGVAAVIQLPWLVFALPSGVLVDRLDRRLMFAIASGTRAVLAVLLLLLSATGHLSIWWLYGVLFLYGIRLWPAARLAGRRICARRIRLTCRFSAETVRFCTWSRTT